MSQTFRRQEYSTSRFWRQRWLPRKIIQCLSFSLKKSTSTCCTKFCKNPKYHSKNYEVFFRKMSKKYLLGLCCSWLCPSTGNSYLYKFINWNPKLVFFWRFCTSQNAFRKCSKWTTQTKNLVVFGGNCTDMYHCWARTKVRTFVDLDFTFMSVRWFHLFHSNMKFIK